MSSFSLPWHDFRTKIIISLWKVYSFRGLHAFKLRKQLSERSIRYSRISFSFHNPSPFSFNFFILGPANELSRGISPTITIQNDRRILFNDTRTQKITNIEKFFFHPTKEGNYESWPICLCRSKIRAGRADNWKRITSALLYRVPVIKLSFAPSEFPVRHFYEPTSKSHGWFLERPLTREEK